MKIVVIGGTGLIGSGLVGILRDRGHTALAASPKSGVDSVTGKGLGEALAGADVVVDVTNAPSWADDDVLRFFETSTRNLLQVERDASVRHHVALSVVGADRLPDSGYLRAKVAQEALIEKGGVPFSILRATQFFEFLAGIADAGFDGTAVRVPSALMQPIAARDVSAALADVVVEKPVDGMIEVGGPERRRFDDLVERVLSARGDDRRVVADPQARYFGTLLHDDSLCARDDARRGPTRLEDWLTKQTTR
ncbi:MAG TPA: SDR family oxidoreductase [Candidatus Binatia bacterium]|nr:SDR family oxidoreductase [Candidatus Binatia bacterium]